MMQTSSRRSGVCGAGIGETGSAFSVVSTEFIKNLSALVNNSVTPSPVFAEV